MADIPDLVRDSKFEAHFPGEYTTEVVHTFQESDPTSRRRLATRSERWKRERRIGGGGSGSVWLERCIEDTRIGVAAQTRAVRAVKQIEMNTQLGSIDYIRELEAIAKFSHDRYQRYFVKSFGWYEGPSQLFIAMEYLEQGDLFRYLFSNPRLPEMEVAEITYQILEGLDMMHENKFAHRDLKPQNILIKSHPPPGGPAGDWWIQLADFGISKRIGEAHGQSSTVKGTLLYSAPEMLGFVERGSPYACDVWALGEIMFGMSTKKPVFANPGLLYKYTINLQQFPTSLLTDIGVSQAGIDFVVSLMRPDPNDRMTVKSALSSLWMASRSVSIPNSSTTTKTNSTSMEAQSGTESSDSVGIVTEELASWTARAFAKAHENDNHARSSHTTRSNRVNPAQRTRGVAQEDISHHRARAVERDASYSRGSNVPPRPPGPGPAQFKPPSRGGGPGIRHPGVLSLSEVLTDTLGGWSKDSKIEDLLLKGIPLFEHDRFRKAEPILQKASRELEKKLGYINDLQVLQVTFHCLHMVGCCLFNLNRYKEAEIILQQAFNIQEKEQKESVFSPYWTTNSPGEVIEYSISRLRYNTGEESIIQWSQFLHMVGSCLHKVGRYENAEIILVQALDIQKEVLGSDHQITRLSLQMLQEGLEITYEQDQYGEDKHDGEHREHGEAEEAQEANQDEGGEEAIAPKARRSRLSRFFRPSF